MVLTSTSFYVLVPVLVIVVDYVVAVTVFFLIVNNIFTHGTDNVEGGNLCSLVSVLFLNIPYSRTYLIDSRSKLFAAHPYHSVFKSIRVKRHILPLQYGPVSDPL